MKNYNTAKVCAKCDADDTKLLGMMDGGYICDRCLEASRAGRDATTRAARALTSAMRKQASANLHQQRGDAKIAMHHQSKANEYASEANDLLQVRSKAGIALGEAVPSNEPSIADTLKTPDMAALDASAYRVDLLGRMGNDCVALGIDASDSIKAKNSLEKMLAHQLAVAHKVALEVTDKSLFEANSVERARLLNVAVRFMDSFQRGLLTLQRLRTGGEQKITIHHVNVEEGGQAIVGSIQTGENRK